jgi:hypothetical protein
MKEYKKKSKIGRKIKHNTGQTKYMPPHKPQGTTKKSTNLGQTLDKPWTNLGQNYFFDYNQRAFCSHFNQAKSDSI